MFFKKWFSKRAEKRVPSAVRRGSTKKTGVGEILADLEVADLVPSKSESTPSPSSNSRNGSSCGGGCSGCGGGD